MTTDVSLKGIKEFAETKNSSESNSALNAQYRHLKDLEDMVNKMYVIREGSTLGCGSHGGQAIVSITTCSGHARTHDYNDLSLGAFLKTQINMSTCSCDSVAVCPARLRCPENCPSNILVCECDSN